jgi:hypothetical protein
MFIPKLGMEYSIWCGPIRPAADFKTSYAVDEVLYVDDMIDWISSALVQDSAHNAKLHILHGVNSDSGMRNNFFYKSESFFEGLWLF